MCSDTVPEFKNDCNSIKPPKFVECTVIDTNTHNDITIRSFWEQSPKIVGLAYDSNMKSHILLDSDVFIPTK